MGKYATITLEMYKKGMKFTCEDIELEEFIPTGDGNMLMDLLNEVAEVCDPDATFQLTEKGEEFYKEHYKDKEECQ